VGEFQILNPRLLLKVLGFLNRLQTPYLVVGGNYIWPTEKNTKYINNYPGGEPLAYFFDLAGSSFIFMDQVTCP